MKGNAMPIPPQTIPVNLSKATPSEMTVDKLETQLTAIGLTCESTERKLLEGYIKDVKTLLPNGTAQSLMILKPDATGEALIESSFGHWVPDGTYGYQTQLEYIQYKAHFDWLKANRTSFTGTEANPPQYSGRASTVSAIKDQFVKVAIVASSTLINGLDEASMESVLSNAIAPLTDKNAKNYDVSDSRVLFLVENYNPTTKEADGIGVLTITWHLVIKDYKEKKKAPEHDWQLTVSARAVLYSSLVAMQADYNAALAHFKDLSRFVLAGIPPEKTKVEVFPSLPPADHSTFIHSLPLVNKADYVDVIVLYAPDLQNIGSIENTDSPATTTFQKSVTSGFTFSTTQELSVTANFEVSVEIVKAGVSIGLSISFTEQWSKSTTETMSFTVPPKAMAFTYQGYMMSALLRYDPSDNTYSYRETARFLTSVIATSEKPLLTDSG